MDTIDIFLLGFLGGGLIIIVSISVLQWTMHNRKLDTTNKDKNE